MTQTAAKQENPMMLLNGILRNEAMQQKFRDILAENAGAFMASIIELFQSDSALQLCDPKLVVLEALKAATLKLPINKQLGFAYIIPYGNRPTFQMGYKGLIQLAQRSGQYRYINADVIYEGETVAHNRITGMIDVSGEATSDTPVGYFAYFQLLNGFEKCVYWTKDKVDAHARRFSKAYAKKDSPWQTEFDAMALKTTLKHLLSKYGILSVEMINAITSDADDRLEAYVAENANGAPIMIPAAPAPTTVMDVVPVHTIPARPAETPAPAVTQEPLPWDDQDGGEGEPGF